MKYCLLSMVDMGVKGRPIQAYAITITVPCLWISRVQDWRQQKNISSPTISGDLGIFSTNVDSLTWLRGPKCFIFALHFRDANQPCAVSALRKWISDLTSSQSWRSWWCKKNKTRYSLIGRVIFLPSWLDWCEISVQVCCCCRPNFWGSHLTCLLQPGLNRVRKKTC